MCTLAGRLRCFKLQVLRRSAAAFTDFLLGGDEIDVMVVEKLASYVRGSVQLVDLRKRTDFYPH
jgi:hypothetical protein